MKSFTAACLTVFTVCNGAAVTIPASLSVKDQGVKGLAGTSEGSCKWVSGYAWNTGETEITLYVGVTAQMD